MITIPKVTDPNSNTGLVFRNGAWYVTWRENGKPVSRSTNTKNVTIAQKIRDIRYHGLVVEGATVATRTRKVDPKGDTYIMARSPFVVRIGNKIVAEAATRREAREKRNAYLKLT